jgi:hypothetical protein
MTTPSNVRRANVALPMSARSCLSVERDTYQPWPRSPTIESFGHAHVLEEDLVEVGLARHLAERADVDAGRLHVDQHVGDAVVLRRVGLGATRANIQSASVAFDVQIFWPFTTQWSPSSSPFVRSDARSLPAPGSL